MTGRPSRYEDDKNASETAYDLLGRPYWTSDGKGYQEFTYDEESGVATEMTDSAAGTFKATYNADGQMTEQLLPDGLAQKISYNPEGTAVGLEYLKTNYCSSACTWLSFNREDSIGGQVLREESSLANHEYTYDKAGRLTLAKEYGTGGYCTTRAYAFDKDSNRLSRTTREPKENGACDTESEGSKTSYKYDTGDRLIGEGVEYDNLGGSPRCRRSTPTAVAW